MTGKEQHLTNNDAPTLNVAEVLGATRALGPGWRSVVWVQGCPLDCPGCLAQGWRSDQAATRFTVPELVEMLLADPRVEGLTFSGGEPMAQAAALAEVAKLARLDRTQGGRDISVICFTGFSMAQLCTQPPSPGVERLLAQTDVLIDGPYLQERDNGRGLRGSENQRVHHLTDRLRAFGSELEDGVRRLELRFTADAGGTGMLMVGIPPTGLRAMLDVIAPDVQDGST